MTKAPRNQPKPSVYQQLVLPQPTQQDRVILNLQAGMLEALMDIESGRPDKAHKALKQTLLESI